MKYANNIINNGKVIKTSVLFVLVIILSCTRSSTENKLITYNLKELPEITNPRLSDLGFDDIKYIPLETKEQGLIERTINISSLGDIILVSDKFIIIKQFNDILKFDGNGKFISQIGTSGRGPNEFQACHDIDIDEDGNIYFYDGWKKRLFEYSVDGSFLRMIKLPLSGVGNFRTVGKDFLFYNENHFGNIENSFNLIDSCGHIIMPYHNKYPFTRETSDAYGFIHENIFYKYRGILYTKEVYCDTIFSFSNMKFKSHIVIDVGDRAITPKARSEFDGMHLAKNYITPYSLFEFGDYIYYEFRYTFDFSNSRAYGFIGSKTNKFQALISLETGIINDLDGGPGIVPLTTEDDNTVVSWIDALQLKKYIESDSFKNSTPKYPEKKNELEKLANNLKETDNPVLMRVRLKK